MSPSEEYVKCISLKKKIAECQTYHTGSPFYSDDLVYLNKLLDKRIMQIEPEVTVRKEDTSNGRS